MQNVSIEGDTIVINTDAVVVGSGAGGGVTAALLAAAGAQASPAQPSQIHCCMLQSWGLLCGSTSRGEATYITVRLCHTGGQSLCVTIAPSLPALRMHFCFACRCHSPYLGIEIQLHAAHERQIRPLLLG